MLRLGMVMSVGMESLPSALTVGAEFLYRERWPSLGWVIWNFFFDCSMVA